MYKSKVSKSSDISVTTSQLQSTITILPGIYNIIRKNVFSIGDVKFIIRERKNPKGNKSKYFISSMQGKNHKYISSLYGDDPGLQGRYNFDYMGRCFSIEIFEDRVQIEKR